MKFFIVISFLSTKKSHPESQCIRWNTFGVIKDRQALHRTCLSLSLDEHKKQQKIQSPWLSYEPRWDHWGAVSALYFEKLGIKTQTSASGRGADVQHFYPLADIRESHVGSKRALMSPLDTYFSFHCIPSIHWPFYFIQNSWDSLNLYQHIWF